MQQKKLFTFSLNFQKYFVIFITKSRVLSNIGSSTLAHKPQYNEQHTKTQITSSQTNFSNFKF